MANPEPCGSENRAEPSHARETRASTMQARRLCAAILLPTILAACLILPGLGGPRFWGDEADCALVAQNILRFGYPRSFDGKYLIETEKTVYAPGYLWNQHPWASHYLCAAGFALLGKSNFAARLPFALAAIAGVALTGVLTVKLGGGARAAFLAGLWLALNTQYLLFAGQVHYYPLIAPAGLLLLWGYLELPRSAGRALFIAGGVLFFHANYVPFVPFIGAIYLWMLFNGDERRLKWKSVLGASAIIVLLTAPWFIGVRAYQRAELVKHVGAFRLLRELKEYGSLFNRFVIPALFLPVAAWLARRRKALRRPFGLCLAICACTVLFIIPVSVTRSLRYTVALFPLLAVLAGFVLEEFFALNKAAAAVLVVLALATHVLDEAAILSAGLARSILRRGGIAENVYLRRDLQNAFLKAEFAEYLRELVRPFDKDPVDGMIDVLAANAQSGDLAVTTWSPKRVYYYTGLDTMCNISFLPPRGYKRPANYPDDPSKYRRIWYMRRPVNRIPQFEEFFEKVRRDSRYRVTKWDYEYPSVQAGNVPDLAVRQRENLGALGTVELFLIEKTDRSASSRPAN